MPNNIGNKVDVLCIGDTVVEPFIKLEKAEVHCGVDSVGCTITLPFGSKIPYESTTMLYGVGNPANAAVSVSRIGLKSALVADIGRDENGEKSLEAWKTDSVNVELVQIHNDVPTNYHYVLWYPPERTILIKHYPYQRVFESGKFSILNPKFIYLTSLPADALDFQNQISDWLTKNPATKLTFQPGTFQLKLGVEAQKDLYKNCYLFVVNKEEAQYVLNTKENKIQKLLEDLQKLGPEVVSITDGPNGAYLRCKINGENIYRNYYLPIYPDIKPPYERTGAGDAFASTFTAYLSKGFSPLEAILRAPINSMSVVQKIGAQEGLLTHDKIEEYLKSAQKDYKLTEI